MSKLLKTANNITPYIIGIAFIVVGGYAAYILYRQNISSGSIIWYLFCLLLIVIPEVKIAFIRTGLLLRREVASVQISELIGHAVRLTGIISLLFLFTEKYIIGAIFLVTSLSVWLSFVYVKKKGVENGLKESRNIDKRYKEILLKYIRLNWHNSAFFAFKGQISIFLLGVFGTTAALADIGALSRYALIFSIISALFYNLYSPSFGRCQVRQQLIRMYIITILGSFFICLSVMVLVYFFPSPFLWILGDDYQHLDNELFLVFIGGSIGFLLGIVYTINLSKGWIKYTPLLEIPTDILGISLGVFLFDISTLTGVLYLGILSGSINLILHLFNSLAGLRDD